MCKIFKSHQVLQLIGPKCYEQYLKVHILFVAMYTCIIRHTNDKVIFFTNIAVLQNLMNTSTLSFLHKQEQHTSEGSW